MCRDVYRFALSATTIFFISCSDGGGAGGQDAGGGAGDGGVVDAGSENGPLAESAKAALRFKRNERIREDFAQALGLAPNELCKELGQYSCTDVVHPIALGGIEPYVLGVREPLQDTTLTAPIAVDRVALSGCSARVKRDFAEPSAAVIFRDLPRNSNGTFTDPTSEHLGAAIDRLYARALQRHARSSEVAHLVAFYQQVLETGQPDSARDWALLSCYAVLSSVESLFY